MAENRWVKLVSALLRATQNGEIEWRKEVQGEPASSHHENVKVVYRTTFLDQGFRLYEYEYKNYVDEDEYYYSNGIELAFIDSTGEVTFEVPREVPGLFDLHNAVQYQTAGIDAFLQKLG